jgi:hypothetical protein
LARIGRQQLLSRCNQVGKWQLPIKLCLLLWLS